MSRAQAALAAIAKYPGADPALEALILAYAQELDHVFVEGPVYQGTIQRISEFKEAPDPALTALAIKLARDLDRSMKPNASTAKEYRETIAALNAAELARGRSDADLLADILDGRT